MRCEEVQNELARDAPSPAVREAVESHLTDCKACRRAQLLFAGIDDTLKRARAWEPPDGFGRKVAAQASITVPTRHPAAAWSILSPDIVHAASLGVLAGTAIYLGAPLVASVVPLYAIAENVVPLAWICMGGSLLVAAWFTRRVLA